jgi:hypothetical protein
MHDVGRVHRAPLKNSPGRQVTGLPGECQKMIKDNEATSNQKGEVCSDEHGKNAEKTIEKAHLEA